MKIGFHARHLSSPNLTGWNRYSINLLRELGCLGTKIVLYGNKPLDVQYLALLVEFDCQVRIAPVMPYFVYEQFWLARQSERDELDVFHSPFNAGIPWLASCATVLTIHDLIEEKFNDPAARAMLRSSLTGVRRFRRHIGWRKDRVQERLYQRIARYRADRVITVSKHAKTDIISEFSSLQGRVSVIYNAAGPEFKRSVSNNERQDMRKRYDLSRPYVLYVGSYQRRKNVSFLIRAFASTQLPDVLLALAGDLSHHGIDHDLIEDLRLTDKVRCVGVVADRDLPAMYAEAGCFVYPSLYEGFGLQLCEAMACRCPTLAADATCLPEVLGGGGEIFSLDDPRQLGALIRRIFREPEFANCLRGKALERSADFSWRRAAEETREVYQAAIAARR